MKTVIATSRDWPYFFFIGIISLINLTIIGLWGFSTAVMLAFIPVAWLLYDVVTHRSIVWIDGVGITRKRGFNKITVPWTAIEAIEVEQQRVDNRYVVIRYEDTKGDTRKPACITLSRVYGVAEEIKQTLEAKHREYTWQQK